MGAHGAPGCVSTECYAMILRHNDSGSQSVLRASIESSKLWFIFGKAHRATMDSVASRCLRPNVIVIKHAEV